uniref:Uncharacterized protein n=1 Tax=Plectus sambesii TaxID=2011161 RepID=A0A914V9U0_9BILA
PDRASSRPSIAADGAYPCRFKRARSIARFSADRRPPSARATGAAPVGWALRCGRKAAETATEEPSRTTMDYPVGWGSGGGGGGGR